LSLGIIGFVNGCEEVHIVCTSWTRKELAIINISDNCPYIGHFKNKIAICGVEINGWI
jgi:hypothetical protein